LYYSLTDYSLLEPPVFIGAENYAEIARDALFFKSLANTAIYALACVVLGTIVSVLIAVLLEQRLRGAGLVRAIGLLPTLAPAVDGMTALHRFRNVTLPMISPAVLFNTIMGAIWGLQVFAVPLIMTKGGPQDSTLVYSMYVFRNAFEYGRMGYASALAWIQFL